MFHAWRNHQGEVVVVAGVCLLLYYSLVRFYIIYSEGGGGPVTSGHGWRPLVDRAAAAGGQRMF